MTLYCGPWLVDARLVWLFGLDQGPASSAPIMGPRLTVDGANTRP